MTATGIPSRAEVDQAVRRLVVETLMLEDGAPESLPADEPDFLTALGANSIDALELIISVEEHFGFEFGDEELRPDLLGTLGEFVDEVCRRIARAAEARLDAVPAEAAPALAGTAP